MKFLIYANYQKVSKDFFISKRDNLIIGKLFINLKTWNTFMFSIENIFHNLHLVDIKRLMVDRITKYLTMKRGKNSREAINDIV